MPMASSRSASPLRLHLVTGIAFFSAACARPLVTPPPPAPPPTFTAPPSPTPAPIPTATLPPTPTITTEAVTGRYLLLSLKYFLGQLGESLSFSVSYQDELPTPQPYPALPDIQDYYPPAVVFKDHAGHTLLKYFLPIAVYRNGLVIDAGLQVEWEAAVPNNPHYACLLLETQPSLPTATMKVSIEPPIRMC